MDRATLKRKYYTYKGKYEKARAALEALRNCGRVRVEMNIALCQTSATDRQLSEMFSNLGDAPSHSQVSRLKDCVAEKIINSDRATALAVLGEPDSGCGRQTLFVRVGHDEFSCLMRIVNKAKSRSQKMLAIICRLYWHRNNENHSHDVEIELKALSDKCAPTLAQALLEVVDEIAKLVDELPIPPRKVSMAIVGDGIGTNVAATRRLAPRVEIAFEVDTTTTNISCLPHSANLITSYGLLGLEKSKLQKHGAIDVIDGSPEIYADLARACSVLYKHLSPGEADQWVARLMEMEPENFPGKGGEPLSAHDESMCILFPYLKKTTWDQHVSEVVKTESHPTPTRFYVFGPCVVGLFVLSYFDLSGSLPGRGQARNKFVTKIIKDAGANLKTSVLAWRVCEHVVRDASTVKADRPLMTRIQNMIDKAEQAATFLVLNLYRDPSVNTVTTATRLLTTTTRINRYMSKFLNYPYRLWRICIKYNASGYQLAARELLDCTAELDEYTLSVRDAIVTYGAGSETVQCELECMVVSLNPDNLPTEREINGITRTARYSRRILTVAVASRNRTLKNRQKNERAVAAQAKKIQKQISIAKGQKHHQPYSLTLQELGMFRISAKAHPKEKAAQDKKINEHMEQHRERLDTECRKRREYAAKISNESAMNQETTTLEDWVAWRLGYPEAWAQLMRDSTDIRRRRLNRVITASNLEWPDQPEHFVQAVPRDKLAKSLHSNESLARRFKFEDNGWYLVKTIIPQQIWVLLFTMEWVAVFTKGRKIDDTTMRISLTHKWYGPLLEVLPDNPSMQALKLTMSETLEWDQELGGPAATVIRSTPVVIKAPESEKKPSDGGNKNKSKKSTDTNNEQNHGGNNAGRKRAAPKHGARRGPYTKRKHDVEMPGIMDDDVDADASDEGNSDDDGVFSEDLSDCELIEVGDNHIGNEVVEIDEAGNENDCQNDDDDEGDDTESEDDLKGKGEKITKTRDGHGKHSKSDGYTTITENSAFTDIRMTVRGRYRKELSNLPVYQHQMSKLLFGRSVADAYVHLFLFLHVYQDKWWQKKETRRSAVLVREMEVEDKLRILSKSEMLQLHNQVKASIKGKKFDEKNWKFAQEKFDALSHIPDQRSASALAW